MGCKRQGVGVVLRDRGSHLPQPFRCFVQEQVDQFRDRIRFVGKAQLPQDGQGCRVDDCSISRSLERCRPDEVVDGPVHDFFQSLQLDGLADVIVHPDGDAFFARSINGITRHCDDVDALAGPVAPRGFASANLLRGFVTVHLG